MPRTARSLVGVDIVYHVICRGNNRQTVFRKMDDYLAYKTCLARAKSERSFEIFHYALMPNHVHLIVRVWHAEQLSKIMQLINLTYALYYKKQYTNIGHLWQDRYKSIIIDNDEYLLSCGAYVELNPFRASLCSKPEEYPWTSHRHYVGIARDPLINEDPIFTSLGRTDNERFAAYARHINGWQTIVPHKYLGREELIEDLVDGRN
ncbi:MAG: transposase [bacterium]